MCLDNAIYCTSQHHTWGKCLPRISYIFASKILIVRKLAKLRNSTGNQCTLTKKYCYHVKHVYINIQVNQDRDIETLAVHLGRAWISKVFQQAVVKTWAEAGTLRRILRCLGRTRGASWAPRRCHNHRQHYWPPLLNTFLFFCALSLYCTRQVWFAFCTVGEMVISSTDANHFVLFSSVWCCC